MMPNDAWGFCRIHHFHRKSQKPSHTHITPILKASKWDCSVLGKKNAKQQRDVKFSTKKQDNPSLVVSPYVIPSLPGLSEFGIHVLQDILQFIGRDGAISVLILGAR